MKTMPIQSMRTDAYNACAFLCKAAVVATAVAATGVALHRFLQTSSEPNCSAILQGSETEEYVDLKFGCFVEEQREIGAGSFENCMAALSDYHPSADSTLDVVAAAGGAEPFCKLLAAPLQESLSEDDLPRGLVKSILARNDCSVVRGIDDSSLSPFVALKKVVTRTYSNPEWSDETTELHNSGIEASTRVNIYFRAFGNTKNAWAFTDCSPYVCHHVRRLEDSDIVNLGRLIRGESVCTSENAGYSTVETVCERLA